MCLAKMSTCIRMRARKSIFWIVFVKAMDPQKKRKREGTDRDTVSGRLYSWFVHNSILFNLTPGGRKKM